MLTETRHRKNGCTAAVLLPTDDAAMANSEHTHVALLKNRKENLLTYQVSLASVKKLCAAAAETISRNSPLQFHPHRVSTPVWSSY